MLLLVILALCALTCFYLFVRFDLCPPQLGRRAQLAPPSSATAPLNSPPHPPHLHLCHTPSPPLSTGKDPSKLRALEVACGTGRFATYVKVRCRSERCQLALARSRTRVPGGCIVAGRFL